jgi:hypothetical protein
MTLDNDDIKVIIQTIGSLACMVALPIITYLQTKIRKNTKESIETATTEAAIVRAALDVSEKAIYDHFRNLSGDLKKNTEICEKTEKISDANHQLANGSKALLLNEIANLKLRIAELTKNQDDQQLAEAAKERFENHVNLMLICKDESCKDRVAFDLFPRNKSLPNETKQE